MKTIYKYAMPEECRLPIGAKFLHFDIQTGKFSAWFEVDPTMEKEDRTFFVIGTGMPIVEGEVYLGTVLEGEFVWHLYERVTSVTQ